MAQKVRWYLCPLETRIDGSIGVPQSIRTQLQGRWTMYYLSGNQWALARIRGEELQHEDVALAPGVFPIPRGRTERWGRAASTALKTRLSALGVTISGNPYPDEVLDLIGQAHQDYAGTYESAWNRAREKRSDEDALGAEEEV